eukprot:CAMPEP_0198201538 /NCGR_PEP_ID=MMETSP1445-20131203/4422_1 /TAXON_ID=36898 /ORGANISM="Pyramimonas sp., Strain CCMP2087" /LENGTH=317 /DNA_ID=CAMNT_0043871945 /DNA_START=120 /DNA_END=1070 /DNA_ORIENTATION=-
MSRTTSAVTSLASPSGVCTHRTSTCRARARAQPVTNSKATIQPSSEVSCRVLPVSNRPALASSLLRFESKFSRSRRGRARVVTSASFANVLTALPSAILSDTPGLLAGVAVNSAVYILGIKVLLAGLTPAGVANSWLLGTMVYAAFGPYGYLLVCLYFVLGSAVTKLKLKQKEAEGIAEARSGRRSPASVWGSGIAAVACSLAALLTPPTLLPLWRIGFVASLASKLNDTTASEVGKAYGKTTYLSTTFQPVPRGTEGAVSLEGTAAGAAAGALVSALACFTHQVDITGAGIVVLAAFLANNFESMLGATVQGKVDW